MRKVTLATRLTRKDLNQTIRALKQERQYILELAKVFVNRLAVYGIVAAQGEMAGNKYAPYITFSKRYELGDSDKARPVTVVLVYGKNTAEYIAEWDTNASGTRKRKAVVNPILMAEFGSGFYANTEGYENVGDNAGQGTFPDQVHAFDDIGWFWYEDGVKHHSFGEAPLAPMMHAYEEMRGIIRKVAEEVF